MEARGPAPRSRAGSCLLAWVISRMNVCTGGVTSTRAARAIMSSTSLPSTTGSSVSTSSLVALPRMTLRSASRSG